MEAAELNTENIESSEWQPSPAGAASETSYARLFAATDAPVLIVDALYGTVLNANIAAARALDIQRSALVGSSLIAMFQQPGRQKVLAALGTARALGVARVIGAHTTHGGAVLNATLSLVRQAGREYVLAHLESSDRDRCHSDDTPSFVSEAIENALTGFLVTDADFNVLYANRTLLEMLEHDSLEETGGSSLTRWLELSKEDLRLLKRQMQARESVSSLATWLYPLNSQPRMVQVLAIAVPDGTQSRWGFSISERPCLN
jgi:PAS domain-containing protein